MDGYSLLLGVEKLQSLRGMVDLLPRDTPLWQHIEVTARRHFVRAGLSEIRTPLMEPTDLFCRGIGAATDVVGKEMYTFLDRGDRSCTLRPEGTASVVRAVVQHGLLTQGPQRLWYGGPMFRYERPQAGRQRQFHQVGVEFLGFADARSDVEAIALAWDLLADLGITGLQLELNTLGSTEDRAGYRHQLVDWLTARRDQLDADSLDRLGRNPLRILDTKHPQTKALLKDAPVLQDALSPVSIERFDQVKQGLSALGIPYVINPHLVRGLDYYSHTAFEITSNQLGAQATLCGGGRYDGLVEQLTGPSTPAIGWAFGMERLVMLFEKLQPKPSLNPVPDVYIVNRGDSVGFSALCLARSLRLHGLIVVLDSGGAAFSKQFKRADRSGAAWAVVLADAEVEAGVFRLQPLRGNGNESTLSLDDVTGLLELISR